MLLQEVTCLPTTVQSLMPCNQIQHKIQAPCELTFVVVSPQPKHCFSLLSRLSFSLDSVQSRREGKNTGNLTSEINFRATLNALSKGAVRLLLPFSWDSWRHVASATKGPTAQTQFLKNLHVATTKCHNFFLYIY